MTSEESAKRYNDPMRSKKLYKVTFLSQGKTVELYARHIGSSALWGFTEVGELVFEQGEGIVVDPTEERLRDEFKNTRVLHLPMAEKTDAEASAVNRGLPIFQAHGMLDPTIPHALGSMSRDYLAQRGYAVEWHAYPMAHQVCMEEIADLRTWMSARLAG